MERERERARSPASLDYSSEAFHESGGSVMVLRRLLTRSVDVLLVDSVHFFRSVNGWCHDPPSGPSGVSTKVCIGVRRCIDTCPKRSASVPTASLSAGSPAAPRRTNVHGMRSFSLRVRSAHDCGRANKSWI